MAQYAIMLFNPAPGELADIPPEEMEAQERYGDQIAELGGEIVWATALHGASTATTVRGDVVTDGPFAETKEVLGGFFVLEARDLDHALEIAKLCPSTQRGAVEVRPLIG